MILDFPKRQEDFFSETYLRELFASRITKSKAVGLDGTRLERFEQNLIDESALIARKVHSGTYKFTAYREKLISKGVGKLPRQISVPTVRDRLTLRALCNCLSHLAPESRTKPPHAYIKEIIEVIRRLDTPSSFIRIDVKDFFPSIRHDLLVNRLTALGAEQFVIKLVLSSLQNPTGKGGLCQNTVGIPQGLSISNILSAIYMAVFDKRFSRSYDYHRYVDDILVISPTRLSTRRYKIMHQSLMKLGLEPHALGKIGKTEISRTREGVDYLGYRVTHEAVSVRRSSYHRMFGNLSKVCTAYKYNRNKEKFLFRLNLRITGCVVDGKRKGWLMFFSQTEDKSQLSYLDIFVNRQIRRLGLDPAGENVARFVKTYHEIRYRGANSSYIPNFDAFTLEQKYGLINTVTGVPLEELNTRSLEITEKEFSNIVAQEISDLEQDVLDSVS